MVFLIQFSSTVDIQARHVSWHHSNIVLPIFIHKYPASITTKNHIYLYQNNILRTLKNQICSEPTISEPLFPNHILYYFWTKLCQKLPKKQKHTNTSQNFISSHLQASGLPHISHAPSAPPPPSAAPVSSTGQLQGRAQHQVHWLPERQKTQGAAVHGDAHA